MLMRKKILPRRVHELFCFFLIIIALPMVFLFEVAVVLPEMHDSTSIQYWFTYILALFLVHNIIGNFIFCLMIDTSVHVVKKHKAETESVTETWHHCEICKSEVPARAWHCKICDSCILKRDHHCVFMGCCIGHRNHRFFILFLVHLAIGSLYAFAYNSLYLWVLKAHIYSNWMTAIKLVCPILLFSTGNSWHNMYILAYSLNFLAVFYSVILLIYHGPIVLNGGTSFEKDYEKKYKYDLGWHNNLLNIFGERMRFVFFSPFVYSKLPSDGISWPQLKNE